MMNHVIAGYKSGYNMFDILWYLLRLSFIDHIHGYMSDGVYVIPKFGWLGELEHKHTWKYRHVVSPVTVLYHNIFKIQPTYTECNKCKNINFRTTECRYCCET